MYKDLVVKTKTLGGTSELTVLAPIRPGLVPSLESVTYKTRVKRLLEALNAARSLSHEYTYFRAFSDAVERVGKIHAVRITIVEPDQVMLSVIFDGGRESYMRTLWQKVGTLLDVIFCNTVNYPCAWDHRFDAWADWVRRSQIDTDYLYAMPATSVDDLRYLRAEEALHLRDWAAPADEALAAVRSAMPSVEADAWARLEDAHASVWAIKEVGRQGLGALALLHRLTPLYLPADAQGGPLPDGAILQRAARDLLSEFVRLIDDHTMDRVLGDADARFNEQIRWLRAPSPGRPIAPPLPAVKPQPDRPEDVQGGILEAYDDITHGCLLLVGFRSPASAARFLEALLASGKLTTADAASASAGPKLNIAFTFDGLRAAGLAEDLLDLFPQEFREGMAARASLLGDRHGNHPLRWRLPVRNWGAAAAAAKTGAAPTIAMSSVHAVLQLRMGGSAVSTGATLDASDPLLAEVTQLFHGHDGVELLSVQPLVRYFTAPGSATAREHFGYADGDGQPVLDPAQNGTVYDRNQVQLGELLLGYANEAETPDPRPTEIGPWLKNGSFLVVRKLAQDVGELRDTVERAVQAIERAGPPFADEAARDLAREQVYAKLMGRWRDGMPLAGNRPGNDFDYAFDPQGSKCPFHAHIRRANPRTAADPDLMPPGQRTPRLMRRGMSYGPRFDDQPEAERGMVFMAYNASIVEQFEVVQRWLAGGNSSGGYSGQSDPLLGVPVPGEPKRFRYEDAGTVRRLTLDGSTDPLAEPKPFVRLDWGLYAFAPSIAAIGRLATAGHLAARPGASCASPWPWRPAEGWARIEALRLIEREQGAQRAADAWKELLEDPEAQRTFASASAWAAIRTRCDGVLRTPYGVIVADRDRVRQVLCNAGGLYSVSGYHDRMAQSIGEIYLGLDDTGAGCPYRHQATRVNGAITGLDSHEAFEAARAATARAIQAFVADEQRVARETAAPRWELILDLKEVVDRVLAALCQQWFGLLPTDPGIVPGGARWDWVPGQPPRYPGHFTAPSRYLFQPRPGRAAQEFANSYGQALQTAFTDLVRRHRDGLAMSPPQPAIDAQAPLARAILAAFPDRADDALVARTLIGVMMGFLPTADGNLRLSMNEWLRDGSFWRARETFIAERARGTPLGEIVDGLLRPQLVRTMLLRPAPELIWRTATRHHRIGDEPIAPGDKIVVAIVSATHQCLEDGDDSGVAHVFGGAGTAADVPTHACPAQAVAMAVMTGFVTALMACGESMRAGAAPLTLTFDGDTPPAQSPTLPPALETAVRVETARPLALRADVGAAAPPRPRVGAGHTLVVDGDSWFRYFYVAGPQNLAVHLQDDHGFEIVNLASVTTRLLAFYDSQDDAAHRRCEHTVPQSARLDKLCRTVKLRVNAGQPPTAVLLSAGGNDVTDEWLAPLLTPKAPGAPLLDDAEVRRVVDGPDGLMRCWLTKVLTRLVSDCVTTDGAPIPVFVHGYDYPVASGLNAFGAPFAAPLLTGFTAAGYGDAADLPLRIDAMQQLIDRLNAMQLEVLQGPALAGRVFHVDLRKTLSNAVGSYAQDWANELHPTQPGFARLADRFVAVMTARIPALQPAPAQIKTSEQPL